MDMNIGTVEKLRRYPLFLNQYVSKIHHKYHIKV